MARRVTVVLSQAGRPNATQRDFEGSLVAELLMVHGLEVTLVPHLTTLESGDTGMLCLEGVTGDMVMLSWLAGDEAHQQLANRQIQGRRGRTRFGGSSSRRAPSAADHLRTIFHIDLRQLESVAACCDEIKRIREEATLKTYGLGVAIADHVTEPPVLHSPPKPAPTQVIANLPQAVHEAEAAEEESLDRLMDQLDEWDS